LGGHDRDADDGPAGGLVAAEVVAQAAPAPRAPGAVGRDADDGADQDREVERGHEKDSSKATSSATHATKLASTSAYTPGQLRGQGRPVASSPGPSAVGVISRGTPGWRTAGRRPARRRAAAGTTPAPCT